MRSDSRTVSSGSRGATSDELARRTVRRVAWRLMPFLLLLYIVAYLDRANVGYAGLQMTRELGFNAAVFGLGLGLFSIGYFLEVMNTAEGEQKQVHADGLTASAGPLNGKENRHASGA